LILLIAIVAVLVYLYEKSTGTSGTATPSEPTSALGNFYQNNLDNLGEAIKQFEGGKPGDLNVRNNNPGNIKSGSYTRSAIGTDYKGFAVFADPGDGWDALNNYIAAHAADHPTWNFYDFFNYYLHGSTTASPVDQEGNATAYANSVASYMGVDPNTPISTLFGYS
jgi:hypothetical protein